MFSNRSQLKKRTPQNGTDRESFLSLLVDEYLSSTSYGARCQILANLANFAYDPINYDYIRNVGVLDILIFCLKNEDDEKLLHYSCAGICNLCVDSVNADYILTNVGIKHFIELLKNISNTDILANIITILIYLYNNQTKTEIICPETIQLIEKLKMSDNKYLVNLATIFIQDYCNSS